MSASSVAKMIAEGFEASGKSQREVATALGYGRPNVVSMLKTGAMRVPIEKVPILAKVLGLNPMEFLQTALREYQAETLSALEEVYGRLPTGHEQEILATVRKHTGQRDPRLETPRQRELLAVFCESLVSDAGTHSSKGDDVASVDDDDFGSWGQ